MLLIIHEVSKGDSACCVRAKLNSLILGSFLQVQTAFLLVICF